MEPDIGIAQDDRAAIAEALKVALADTFALYEKTHLYHWNVHGPRFGVLHPLFEEQYNALWLAVDEIAERIRALGHYAPTPLEIETLTSIPTSNDTAPSEDTMLRALLVGHETLVKSCRSCLDQADDDGDDATVDLMAKRIGYSEKAAWMLRSHLPM